MAKRFIAVLWILAGCQAGKPPVVRPYALAVEGNPKLFVYASDFVSGGMHEISLRSGEVTQSFPSQAQALLRCNPYNQTVGILNQLDGPYFTQVSPGEKRFTTQFALPARARPQDVFFTAADEAWFSFHGQNALEKRRLTDGKILETVLEGGETLAEWSHFVFWDGLLWVVAQNLDDATARPLGLGTLYPVEDAHRRRQTALLTNPFAEPRVHLGKLYVGSSGALDLKRPVLDGLLYVLDPSGQDQFALSERALGGDLLGFEITGPQRGFAIVQTPDTSIVRFEKDRVEPLLKGQGYQFSSMVWDEELRLLFVADRDRVRPGIRVLDTLGVERKEAFIPLANLPFSFALRDQFGRRCPALRNEI